MGPEERHMHINAYLLPAGHHDAAWRLPETRVEKATQLSYFSDLARTAERGKFDSVFFADGVAMWGDVRHRASGGLEPLTLLAALSAVTDQVGLIATASTTFNSPYQLARQLASIDHLSNGRAGWNIVTSTADAEAQNFNLDRLPDHDARYRRAREFVEVVTALWDSWESDAIVLDVQRGLYADDTKIHEIGHHGEFFSVRGPLNIPRSPQGYPLLMQAGSSEDGKEFASNYADAIFTLQPNLPDAQRFYREMKSRARLHGRDPRQLKILPGICPVLGSTEAEARELNKRLAELVVPEYALSRVSMLLKADLSALSLDDPLPPPGEFGPLAQDDQIMRFWHRAAREELTIGQVYSKIGVGREVRVATPEQIANRLQEWFTESAADGFNVMPPLLPGGLEKFVEHVIPLLQRRGVFRIDYSGRTLRENYGLPFRRGRSASNGV